MDEMDGAELSELDVLAAKYGAKALLERLGASFSRAAERSGAEGARDDWSFAALAAQDAAASLDDESDEPEDEDEDQDEDQGEGEDSEVEDDETSGEDQREEPAELEDEQENSQPKGPRRAPAMKPGGLFRPGAHVWRAKRVGCRSSAAG